MARENSSGYWVCTEDIRNGIKEALISEVINEAAAMKLLEILLHEQEYIERK